MAKTKKKSKKPSAPVTASEPNGKHVDETPDIPSETVSEIESENSGDTDVEVNGSNGLRTTSEIDDLKLQIQALKLETSETQSKYDDLNKKYLEVVNKEGGSKEEETKKDEVENSKLEEVIQERDHIKAQYDSLFNRISSMKSVFAKMKQAETEAEELREQVQTLNDENTQLKDQLNQSNEQGTELATLKSQTVDLNNECDRLTAELSSVRKQLKLKESGYSDEKYEMEINISKLTKKNHELKSQISEYEVLKQDQDVEVTNLNSVIEELKQSQEIKTSEIKNLKLQADQYNSQIQELQVLLANKVKDHESQLEAKNQEITELTDQIQSLNTIITTKDDLIKEMEAKTASIPVLEKEVETKQILLGKARHEAIILNEHLSKALGMLKKQSNSENNTIDKELISNVLINFLQLPRGDTKKFEALQLISSLLEWNEDKKVASGLSNQGSKTDNNKRDSFVSLWTDFLERESTKS